MISAWQFIQYSIAGKILTLQQLPSVFMQVAIQENILWWPQQYNITLKSQTSLLLARRIMAFNLKSNHSSFVSVTVQLYYDTSWC